MLTVDFDHIPGSLKALPQWVLHRKKEPYQINGARAKTNTPETWTTFEAVREAYKSGKWDGIGFVFARYGGIVGIDLDKCIDENGVLEPWAAQIVEDLNSYTEYSVSGTGLHIIVRAELEKGKRKGRLEIYPHGRYFTFTGRVYGEAREICEAQSAVDRLIKEMSPKRGAGAPPFKGRRYLPNAYLITAAIKAKNGPKFTALWNGDTLGYPSQSEADIALVEMLLFWTNGDIERTSVLFGESALAQRSKWTERSDYRKRTLDKAYEYYLSRQGRGAGV